MPGSLYAGTTGLAFISLCFSIATRNKYYPGKAIRLTNKAFAAGNQEFGAFIGDASYAFVLELLCTLTGESSYLTRAINIVHNNLNAGAPASKAR